MTKISKNFTVQELVRSQTASRHGIDNTPRMGALIQLVYLSIVMQSVRDLFGNPVIVTSGYRCLELNRKIGSKDTSKHIQGRACDFVVSGMGVREAFELIKRSHIGYSKMILEFPDSGRGWIHLEINEFAERSENRRHLLAERVSGRTQYSHLT